MSDAINPETGRRGFLKKLCGAVGAVLGAPLVPEVVVTPSWVPTPEDIAVSVTLAEWLIRKKREEITAAIALGHEGPWTFHYRLGKPRVLVDGNGVEV